MVPMGSSYMAKCVFISSSYSDLDFWVAIVWIHNIYYCEYVLFCLFELINCITSVTNSGVVLDPLGCRTLYLSERNWKIGVRGPLYVCSSCCVLFFLCDLLSRKLDVRAHIYPFLTNNREARLGLIMVYLPLIQFVMLDLYCRITIHTDFDPKFVLTIS